MSVFSWKQKLANCPFPSCCCQICMLPLPTLVDPTCAKVCIARYEDFVFRDLTNSRILKKNKFPVDSVWGNCFFNQLIPERNIHPQTESWGWVFEYYRQHTKVIRVYRIMLWVDQPVIETVDLIQNYFHHLESTSTIFHSFPVKYCMNFMMSPLRWWFNQGTFQNSSSISEICVKYHSSIIAQTIISLLSPS